MQSIHASHCRFGPIQYLPTETLELRTASEARFQPRRVFWFFGAGRITSYRLLCRVACGQAWVAEPYRHVGQSVQQRMKLSLVLSGHSGAADHDLTALAGYVDRVAQVGVRIP